MLYYNEKKKIYTVFFSDGSDDIQTSAGKTVFKNADEAIGGAKALLSFNLDIKYICVFELTLPVSENAEPIRECIWECADTDDEDPFEVKKEIKEDINKKYS